MRHHISLLVLLALCCMVFSGIAEAIVWSPEVSGTTAKLYGVKFVNTRRGWAVGNLGVGRHTTDGGLTWSAQALGGTQPWYGVTFVDSLYGWVVGASGRVVRTTNGGSSWTLTTVGTVTRFANVSFTSRTNGWAAGYYDSGYIDTCEVCHTTDGGVTWTPQWFSGFSGGQRGVSFVDSLHGWICGGEPHSANLYNAGEYSAIWRTTNGGSTWTQQLNSPNVGNLACLSSIVFANTNYGWATGDNTARVWRTTNGGSSWTWVSTPFVANAVTCVSQTSAYAVGNGGQICHTTNSGATWNADQSLTDSTLYAVSCVSDNFGIAAGAYGTILRNWGTTISWNTATDGWWTNPTLWTPSIVPSAQDTVLVTLPGGYYVKVDSTTHARAGRLTVGQNLHAPLPEELIIDCAACSLSLYKDSYVLTSGWIYVGVHGGSGGRLVLENPGTTLTVGGAILMFSPALLQLAANCTLLLDSGLDLGGALSLSDSAIVQGGPGALFRNRGRISQSALPGESNLLSVNYYDDGSHGRQSIYVTSGKLSFVPPDSAVFNSNLYINGGPWDEGVLELCKSQVRDSATIDGSGALYLCSGGNIGGHFPFSGHLRVESGTVSLHPLDEAVTLDSLTLDSGVVLNSTVPIQANVIAMHGASMNAPLSITQQCSWTSGDLTGAGSDVNVASGATLTVSGDAPKTLASHNLSIDGSADFSGSGAIALSNGAQVIVDPTGSLTLHDSLQVTGASDTLVNHGMMQIQAQIATAFIQPFIWNTPSQQMRTPGTIDILGRMECNKGQNDGTIGMSGSYSQLQLDGDWTNNGQISIFYTDNCAVMDTLINAANGVINLYGSGSISGAGLLINQGHIYRYAGTQRTAQNNHISTIFQNQSGGHLEILYDTLQVGDGYNAGEINIHPFAVLSVTGNFVNLPGGVIHGGGTVIGLPPALSHDPLGDFALGTGNVTAIATSYSSAISTVRMYYRFQGAQLFDSLSLSASVRPHEYAASLSAIVAGAYEYYIRAFDTNGKSAKAPTLAPATLYTFDVARLCANELFYDDGSADKFSYCYDSAAYAEKWAVKFNPTSVPFVLSGARVAVSRSVPDTVHSQIHVYVYAADGTGGLPGTLLQDCVTGSIGNIPGGVPLGTNWAQVVLHDIQGAPLIINNSPFYVAVSSALMSSGIEAFGRDTTGTNAHRSYYFGPCNSQWISEDTPGDNNAHPGNRMIRAQGYPLRPPNITLYCSGSQVRLNWSNQYAPLYTIYRSSNVSGPFNFFSSTTDTFTTVSTTDTASVRMFYQVKTVAQ